MSSSYRAPEVRIASAPSCSLPPGKKWYSEPNGAWAEMTICLTPVAPRTPGGARLVALGLQTYPDEVVAVGPPWSTTVCVRGHDELRGADGEIVYANRFVIWGHLAWGRLRRYEVYEDTHAPDELDAWIIEHRPELAHSV